MKIENFTLSWSNGWKLKIRKPAILTASAVVMILAFTGLVAANLGGFTKPTPPDLSEGLVAYYPFNGNANDASGNGNDGTLEDKNTGNGDGDTPPQLTTDRRGNSNSAYSFDGVDDYIVHPTSGMQASSGTVAGWVKPNQSADWGFWQTHDSDGSNWLDWITMFSYTSDTFYYRIGDGSQCCSNDVTFSPTSSLIPVGEWTHLTFTWGGSDMKLYVNGQLERSRSNATLQNNMDPFARIGQGHDRMMDGALDNLRMYDRALSSSEVEYLYTGFSEAGSSSVEIASTQGSLVGQWGLGEGFGAKDRTPNGNNGTVNGATLTTDRRGQSESAYSFDGTNDYVNLSDNLSTDGSITDSDFTVSAWTNANSKTNPVVFSQGIPANWASDLFILYVGDSGSSDGIRVWWDGGSVITYATSVVGSWHHVALTRSGSDLSLYLDGSQVATGTASTSWTSTNAYIGAADSNGSITQYYSGKLDDVRTYNRALSQQEIQDMADSYKPSVQVSDLQKGLVGHWSFNNLAKDITPYTNHGTPTDADGGNGDGDTPPQLTTDRRGNADRAYDFDGTDDEIRISHDSVLDIRREITLSFWFKTDTYTGTYSPLLTKMNSSGSSSTRTYAVFLNNSGFLHLGSADSSGQEALNTPANLNTGQWYHYTAVIDRNAGTMTSYVDGSQVAQTSVRTNDTVSNTHDVLLGGSRGYSVFDGKIDGVRIYNRALTANEVETLSEIYR